MFRIHFVPKIGQFCIQVLMYGMFWVTVKGDYQFFTTLEAAYSRVEAIGLDKLYEDKSRHHFTEAMREPEPEPEPVPAVVRKSSARATR